MRVQPRATAAPYLERDGSEFARYLPKQDCGATGQAVIDCLFAEHARLGSALLLITHEAALAERCERQLRMADGHIVEERRAPSRRLAL